MDIHEAVLQHMEQLREKFAAQGINLRLLPPSVEVLGTRYVEVDYRKMLATSSNHSLIVADEGLRGGSETSDRPRSGGSG